MNNKQVIELIKKNNIQFIDLRFTDTRGKEQHVCVPNNQVDQNFFKNGKLFDGSSIAGWKDINESDMILMPDPSTAVLDPFRPEATLLIRCDIIEPSTMQHYERCPRNIARRAEQFLLELGLADVCYVGPEPEFFILDDVQWETKMNSVSYSINSQEGVWNSGAQLPNGNLGHRPGIKGGYFPVPPVDSSQDIRSVISLKLKEMGLSVEAHHHEVSTANQNEISTEYRSLLRKADELQILKYVVHNVAHQYGKTATFMPKPVVGDNGSGMHCHFSLAKNGNNCFAGDQYSNLSPMALYAIGGILKHAKAINAFTNSATNSYKRLIPGFEAPVHLTYSKRNRSAAIRIPHFADTKGARIEVRFPDAATNPYLAFSALLMGAIDGIENKIHPGDATDINLYELDSRTDSKLGSVARSLDEAIDHLNRDREFLCHGHVFNNDLIDSYIELKQEEITRLMSITHPVEFELYYSL